MTETDKLLVRIGTARDAISRKTELTSLDYMIEGVLMNCSVLLKEQSDHINKLEDANAYLENAMLDDQTEIVRCKNCKFSIAAVFGSGRYCGLHKKTQAEDWYCADGERREGDA